MSIEKSAEKSAEKRIDTMKSTWLRRKCRAEAKFRAFQNELQLKAEYSWLETVYDNLLWYCNSALAYIETIQRTIECGVTEEDREHLKLLNKFFLEQFHMEFSRDVEEFYYWFDD